MAFLEKLNSFANVAGTKATGAIETSKLNLKIISENKKLDEATTQLGLCVLQNMDNGEVYDDALMSIYEDIKAFRTVIADSKALMVSMSGQVLCDSCGAKNADDSNFCHECGQKIEVPVVETAAEEVAPTCPSCHENLDDGISFCPNCGTKVEEAALVDVVEEVTETTEDTTE